MLALLFFAGASMLAYLSLAAPVPPSMTVSPANPTFTYTDGPFVVSNPSAQAGDPICTVPMSCSDFGLTVDVGGTPDPTKHVRVAIEWPLSAADFDVYVYAGFPATGSPIATSASSADPEVIILPAQSATYTVRVVPFAPAGQTSTGTVSLESVTPPPPPGSAPPPRYLNYPAPASATGADSSGEPSIGVDWNPNVASLKNGPNPPAATVPPMNNINLNLGGVAFFTANLKEFRVNFDDCSSPAKNAWEDVTRPSEGVTSLDPIGFVDHQVPGENGTGLGRVFQSQLAGASSITAYSDTDGNTWTQSQGSGQPAGVDHQTLGGGPFNETAVPPPVHPLYKHQIYYASQDIGTSFASRSDNGGLTFNAGVPMWTLAQCGGLHGHVKVGPDGTTYVPNKSCGGDTAVAVSRDNGLTWTIKPIPGSGSGDTDPSVGIATDNTVYVGYQKADGHPHIAVSTDHGDTWHDVDAGAGIIQNCVFPEVVAGDGNRAAFAFIGTTTTGGYQSAATFTGTWYYYIATTFDRGQTYTLVDATNGDPVQVGSICTGGTTCGSDRNLLDFTDLQLDAEGRVLAGYADGCVAPTCDATTAGSHPPPYNESRSALGSVLRQSGGPRLYSAFDSQANCGGSPLTCTPTAPGAPRVESVAQSGAVVHLVWSQPDKGGSPLTGYNVYRKDNIATTYVRLGITNPTVTQNCPACKTTYDDATAGDPTLQYTYKVTAVNQAAGEGASCGEFVVASAGPLANPCLLPGITILTDPAGDIVTPIGQSTNPGWDLRSLSLAEPFLYASPDRIVFTLKTEPPTGGLYPANSRWPVQFLVNGNTTLGYFVDMSTMATDGGTPAAPVFRYGTFNPTGGTGGVYGAPTTVLGTLDPASNFNADGTITMIVQRSLIGNPAIGGHLNGFLVRVRFGSDTAAVTPDNMANSLAPSGDYTVVGNASCAPNQAPVAALTAYPVGNPSTPPAGDPPLSIHFDASASSDPDPGDTISSYTFDFGDGSAPVTQSTPTIDHTYMSNGNFRATVRVKDNHGLSSGNAAQVQIEVDLPLNAVVSRKTHGAAGTFDISLLNSDGTSDVECRAEGNGYLLVYTFGATGEFTVTGSATSVTSSNGGTVASHGPGPGANQYSVTLTGVPNAQHHLVTLDGVPVHNNSISGSAGDATLRNVGAQFGVLLGDVTNNGTVNSTDVSQIKPTSGSTPNASNFRNDGSTNGTINSTDVSVAKAQSGTTFTNGPAQGAAKTKVAR
ncbi:MAG: PKD domain-containing protein [Chthoniobacterales bacterium]